MSILQTRLVVSGVDYSDYNNLMVNRSIGDFSAQSNFNVVIDSPYGRHKTDFQIGNNIDIYAGYGELDGLKHIWRMNGSNAMGIVDEFNKAHATFVGSGVVYSQGKISSGLSFPGGSPDYVSLNAGSIDNGLNNSFTVAGWFNPATFTSGTIFSIAEAISTIQVIHVIKVGSDIKVLTSDVDSNSATSIAPSTFSLGSWYHFAAVKDAGSVYIYLNGSVGNTAYLATSSNPSTAQRYRIGLADIGAQLLYPYSGLIDDLRIYNKVLTQDQVTKLYNSGSGTLDYCIFRGVLEDIEFNGQENDQKVRLSGRDYGLRLSDILVQPVIYTNQEASAIIESVLSQNAVPDITVNNVQTTTVTLPKTKYNYDRVEDVIQDLSKLTGNIYYVDAFKDLHFEPRFSYSSNINVGSENIMSMVYDTNRQGMFNRITVVGDRYLTGFTEVLPTVGGSAFNLQFNPYNPSVTYLGSIRKGGVFNLLNTNVSGNDYLTDFDNKQLVFVSGTTIGYSSIPASGGSIVVDYQRSVPIIKYGENPSSIQLFGPKDKVIRDNSIRDPQTATTLVEQYVIDADPLRRAEANIQGWYDATPGTTISMQLNDFDVLQSGISIIETNYDFNPEKVMKNNVITLKLSRKMSDVTDYLKDINTRLASLETSDLEAADLITRIQFANNSITVVGSSWKVYTRTLNSSFSLGLSGPGTNPQIGGRLGSVVASGINPLGAVFGAYITVASGGNNYSVTGSYNAAAPPSPDLNIQWN